MTRTTASGSLDATSAALTSRSRTGVGTGSAMPTKSAEPFKPSLSLRPVAISLAKGATQAFQAEINYPEGMRYMRHWDTLCLSPI